MGDVGTPLVLRRLPGLRPALGTQVDGPYNHHLLSDFGTVNLALAVVTITAAVTLSRPHVIAVALAWLVSGIPHLNYHLHHLDVFSSTNDHVIGGAFLSAVPILALAVMALALLTPASGAAAPPEPAPEPATPRSS